MLYTLQAKEFFRQCADVFVHCIALLGLHPSQIGTQGALRKVRSEGLESALYMAAEAVKALTLDW